MANFLIYGANGYTGEITAHYAIQQGLHPILAGRSAEPIKALSAQLDLEHCVFGLDDPNAIDSALRDVDAVLHFAGPFKQTWKQMADACLRTGTHYLDITGEIAVYQGLAEMSDAARKAGIMFLPGIGYDVVPTDCLAAHLKGRLPSATHLTLAFRQYGPAQISRGTGKTFVEGLPFPGRIRQNGKLTQVPHLSKYRMIDFGQGAEKVPRMTWGDVFTAYHSTGIPNSENYFVASKKVLTMLRMSRYLGRFLGWGPIQNFLKGSIEAGPRGSTSEEREKSYTFVWGEVQDKNGQKATSRLRTPEAYNLTALTSLAAIKNVLSGIAPAGYQTPATAFGADFILQFEGVERVDLD